MKKIFIGFSDGRNLFSSLIKFATSSKISHCFIGFEETGHNMIFQASGISVNYENNEHFLTHAKVVDLYSKIITDEEWEHMKCLQLDKLGYYYSYREIVGYACVLLCSSIGLKIKNPFYDGDHAYVCVELTLEQLGEEWNGTMTPEQLRNWCKSNKNFTQESIDTKVFK